MEKSDDPAFEIPVREERVNIGKRVVEGGTRSDKRISEREIDSTSP